MEDTGQLGVESIRLYFRVTKKNSGMIDLDFKKWKTKLTKKDLKHSKKKHFWMITVVTFTDGSGTISSPGEISGDLILCDMED